jgi:hypothetical protein
MSKLCSVKADGRLASIGLQLAPPDCRPAPGEPVHRRQCLVNRDWRGRLDANFMQDIRHVTAFDRIDDGKNYMQVFTCMSNDIKIHQTLDAFRWGGTSMR